MKCLFLAAGTGSRLMPLTENTPKCLVTLGGKKLLDWQMESLKKCGVTDYAVVGGYKMQSFRESVGDRFSALYDNQNYLNTNMVHSLFCAEAEMNADMVVSYGDIIYSADVVNKLTSDKSDFCIVVDKKWLDLWSFRFENPLSDAESLTYDADLNITSIGAKVADPSQIMGQYIGLMKFSKRALEIIKSYKGKNLTDLSRQKSIPFEKAYMTDLLQTLIVDGHKLKAVLIQGDWLEVDSLEDHNKYTTFLRDHPQVPIFQAGRPVAIS